MGKLIKIAGICFLTVGIAACGGGGGGGSSVGGNGGSNGGDGGGSGSGGTPVASRTGEADYVGTFTAKVSPNRANASIGGKRYTGGNFTGDIKAQADFDSDTIDLELVGHRKQGVMDAYDAEFDDARIVGRDFWGQGRESIVIDGPNGSLVSRDARAKVRGEFAGGGSKISGKTTTLEKDRLVTIETDFSGREQ